MLAPFAFLSRPLQSRRVATGLIVCAMALLAAPGAAWAQAPDFTWSPDPLSADETATFTPSGIPEGATVTWDFENDKEFVSASTHTFADEGSYPVTMRIDGSPASDVTKSVPVDDARPVAAFTFTPEHPDPLEPIQFVSTSTDDGAIASVAWDFDDDGNTDSTSPTPPAQIFLTPGPHDVTLTAVDSDGTAASVTRIIGVTDPTAPTASFDRSVAVPETGQAVTFTSTSQSSLLNAITSYAWDVDGDGFDDGNTSQLTTSFGGGGQAVVRLQVTQTNGRTDTAVMSFRVNRPPVAGFVWSPTSPLAGAAVELVSTSADADGAVAHEWELDGDGDFNDATTATASATFAAGMHDVGLRVTDGDGVSRTAMRSITVVAAAGSSPALRVLSPVVRLAGTLLPRGTRISILSVRAPRGAVVTARCRGRGCPIRSQRKRSRTGLVRFRDMEALLRPRARVEVLVQASGAIGRYTRFRIRAGKRPKRTDLCLPPGSSEPQEACDA